MAGYKRPDIARPSEYHNILKNFSGYGQLSDGDPGWIYAKAVDLMDDGCFALFQLSKVIDKIKDLDLSQYKDSIAKQKKQEPILKARQALMTFLAKHISKAAEEIKAVENKILRVTAPDVPSDSTKAMLQEMKMQEIRTLIRSVEPGKRDALIRANLSYIQAAITSPDLLLSESHLIEIRRSYAFNEDPTLQNLESDTKQIYTSIRSKAAEINSTGIMMLIKSDLDDPLPPQEHFAVFEPQTDYEKHIAGQRIQDYEREQTKLAKGAEFEKQNEGVNVDRQKRLKRNLANVQ